MFHSGNFDGIMKKYLMLLPFILLCAMHGKAQVVYIQGEHWGVLDADTVVVTGNVTVPAEERLTFVPGTTVRMTGYFKFKVQGSVLAEGQEGLPVLFTVSDTSGFYRLTDSRGGWDGFDFTETVPDSDSSVFSYCIFEYGKATGDSLSRMGGVFNIRGFSKLRIANCLFRSNKAMLWGGALFAEQSAVVIRDSEFTDNFCGPATAPYGYGGAVCLRNSIGFAERNNFTANRSTGVGGGLSAEYSDVLVRLNVFTQNHSGLGGALAYVRSEPLMTVNSNVIAGNSSEFFGGGACFLRANPVMANNTIVENTSVYGGGIYCNDSAAPVFVNSILWGNTAYSEAGNQVYIFDNLGGPVFSYCDVEGGLPAFGGAGGSGYTLPYLNNIDTIPDFSQQLPSYALTDNSACVNVGDPDTTGLMLPLLDIAGNNRFFGVRVDIGACENPNVVSAKEVELPGHQTGGRNLDPLVTVYRKSGSGNICIDSRKAGKTVTHVQIADASGRLLQNVHGLNSEVTEVTTNGLPGGVFFVVVELAGGGRVVSAMVL